MILFVFADKLTPMVLAGELALMILALTIPLVFVGALTPMVLLVLADAFEDALAGVVLSVIVLRELFE